MREESRNALKNEATELAKQVTPAKDAQAAPEQIVFLGHLSSV